MALFAPVAVASPATATVEKLHGALLDIMQNAATLGFVGRRDRIAPVVKASYDMGFVTRLLMGATWAQLDDASRQRATDTVERYTVATYAARFDGFAGEAFETVSEEALASGRIHVRTRLVKSDGEAVQLDYVLHETEGSARIINVVADGVSDLSLKRAEYAAVIHSDGFDALMRRIEQQIADYAAAGG